MAKALRILTFNHHESYLCSLAKTGHHFDVVERYGNLDLTWKRNQRPLPENFSLTQFDTAVKLRLRRGDYDVVVCHTIKNLLWLFFYFKPRYVFVAHIPLFYYTPALRLKSVFKKIIYTLFKRTHRSRFFAVSRFKLKMWGEEGTSAVLEPNVFPPVKEGCGYDRIVVVANELAQRPIELGYDMVQYLMQDYPVQTIGNNPGVPGNIVAQSFTEFQQLFSSFRIYLYTVRQPYGDGYNTALLEAMRMGMAIVTIANASSPIIHEQNGLVADNVQGLKKNIARLLSDPVLVDSLGRAAAQTIALDFTESAFVDAWHDVLR